jgi:hypothetical protein
LTVPIDIDDVAPFPLELRRRRALEIPTVKEQDRPIVDIGRRGVDQPAEREERVLVWQREVTGIDEHQAVLAKRGEDLLHRHQRAEGISVGVLVGDHHELVRVADLAEHQIPVRGVPVSHPRPRSAD